MGNEIVKPAETANQIQVWGEDPEFNVRNNFLGGAEPRLPRIEIIHRGQMFREVTTGETFQHFLGYILHYQRFNGWWKQAFQDGQSASFPDCGSSDGIKPDQGDDIQSDLCANCPRNEFGEGGKECKNNIRLHVLRPGEILPIRIIVPATSLKPFSEYISHLTLKNIPYQMALTKFSLAKTENAQKIEYSKIALSLNSVVNTKELVVNLKDAIGMNRKQFQAKQIALDETAAPANTESREVIAEDRPTPAASDSTIPF